MRTTKFNIKNISEFQHRSHVAENHWAMGLTQVFSVLNLCVENVNVIIFKKRKFLIHIPS